MLSFGSCRVVSPSNRALYITSVGWVYSLTLGAVLILSEFISTNWLSFQSPWSLYRCLLCHRDVPVLYIESMLPTLSHHLPLCSCSKEFEAWIDHSSVFLTLHVDHSQYLSWFEHIMIESFHIIQLCWVPRVGWWGMPECPPSSGFHPIDFRSFILG